MMDKLNYIPKYTFLDYLNWKGDWELIKGSPVSMSPSPTRKHKIVGNKINNIFYNYLNLENNNSNCQVYYEMDWKVDKGTVLRSDLSIVCNESETDFIETIPSLIVEILSPSTRLKDRNTKFGMYQQIGVKYYIMVDPNSENIEIFQLIDNKYKEVKITEFEIAGNCILKANLENIFN